MELRGIILSTLPHNQIIILRILWSISISYDSVQIIDTLQKQCFFKKIGVHKPDLVAKKRKKMSIFSVSKQHILKMISLANELRRYNDPYQVEAKVYTKCQLHF